MSVTYSREQREHAKKHRLPLVTVSVPGVEFQGPVPQAEAEALIEWMTAFYERRRLWLATRSEEKP